MTKVSSFIFTYFSVQMLSHWPIPSMFFFLFACECIVCMHVYMHVNMFEHAGVCVYIYVCIEVDTQCPLCNTIITEQDLLLNLEFVDSGVLASQVVVRISLSLLPESQFYRRLACMLGL